MEAHVVSNLDTLFEGTPENGRFSFFSVALFELVLQTSWLRSDSMTCSDGRQTSRR
jgi:hypothetical protein